MTLIVSETTANAATQNLPEVPQSLWQDSLQTFPLVHTALELIALAAKAHGVSAVILPTDLENLEGFSLETYSLQVKSFKFSDAPLCKSVPATRSKASSTQSQ